MNRDHELRDHLSRAAVKWTPLDDAASGAVERSWREIYGRAFVGRPRLRQGTKAEHAYAQEICTCYLIVPFTSNVDGLPIHVVDRSVRAYECHGPLIPLGAFHDVELFACPSDLAWTMVHTHEDHSCGGPNFIRRNWLP
jgi:hypothetical protein